MVCSNELDYRRMLETARTLIVDEIHAVVGDKRGSHLALSIERLEQLGAGVVRDADPGIRDADGHIAPDGGGITLVNIGVGPSNAKTICDHIAVLRPEVWLMIGHCGGLRPSQTIGDYVLAHAYLRDDHVLDDVLPVEIPLPAIAEVQQALYGAAEEVSGAHGADLKQRMRTGTVVTTDDRNWELQYTQSARRMSLSRAVGVDMESATIAANGFYANVLTVYEHTGTHMDAPRHFIEGAAGFGAPVAVSGFSKAWITDMCQSVVTSRSER